MVWSHRKKHISVRFRSEAHATLGMVYYAEYELRGAEDEFKVAVELKPSYATAHQWYHILLRAELRLDEALKEIEKVVEAYSKRESALLFIQSDWVLDGVRNDPRYLDLLKRLGL